MASDTRFDPDTLQRRRRALLDRGQTLATLLADVMAGQRPPSLEALLAAKPGERPEEALRRALDQIETRRRLLDTHDDRYGRCDVCSVALDAAELDEMPWADRCPAHMGR